MNWFLTNLRDNDADTLATAKLLLVFTLVAVLACLLFVPIFYFVSGSQLALYAALVTPFVAGSALVLRWTGSVALSATYYLVTAWLWLTGVMVLLGGAASPGPPAYYLLVLGATFMLGRRAGITWTIICLATIVGTDLAHRQWKLADPISHSNMTLLALCTYSAVLGLICIFSLKYDEEKSNAVLELRSANRRTADMITQLERTSDRLVRSSEQLLGSEQDKARGMVGQMMKTARQGRHTIEEAKESVVGMIEQYRHISERVQGLYRHTQTIVELVSTIDRISGRLDLMALNIGIEAARSGKSGQQFTMIAQDMRVLAERVLSETQRIKSSLESVNVQVQGVLQSSASGQGLTEESVARMNVMVSTFDEIYALIEKAEGATGKITADTLAQIDAVRRLVTVAEGDSDPLPL